MSYTDAMPCQGDVTSHILDRVLVPNMLTEARCCLRVPLSSPRSQPLAIVCAPRSLATSFVVGGRRWWWCRDRGRIYDVEFEGVVFDTAGEDRQFLRDLAVSTIALLVAYNAVIGAFPVLRLPENTKRCAWVLSIFSSCVCGPVCLPYVWRYVFQEWDEVRHRQRSDLPPVSPSLRHHRRHPRSSPPL